jgi:hypothetical protein
MTGTQRIRASRMQTVKRRRDEQRRLSDLTMASKFGYRLGILARDTLQLETWPAEEQVR